MPSRQLTRRQLRLACSMVLASCFVGFALGQALGRQSMPATSTQSIQTQGGLGVGANAPSESTATTTPTTTPATTQDGGRTYVPAPSRIANPAPAPAHSPATPPQASSQQHPADGKPAPERANHGKREKGAGDANKSKDKPKRHGHKDDGRPKRPEPTPAQ